MLSDKEKNFLQKKIKNISSTNEKISVLLREKLTQDFKNKNELKKKFKNKIIKCEKDFFHLYNIASDMWFLAGDKSVDYNFYTKRIILSSILSKLYLKIFFIKDYNEDNLYKDIKLEIEKVGKFNKFKSEFLNFFKKIKDQKTNSRGY